MRKIVTEPPALQTTTDERPRFIPFRRADLVDMLVGQDGLEATDRDGFRALAELLSATFHVEFRARLEALKDAYAPFAHDPDTRTIRTWSASERAACLDAMEADLRELLDDANYRAVERDELEGAFEEESLIRLRVQLDLDDFDRLLFFRRGQTMREQEVKTLVGLRTRSVTFTNYEKVLVLVTFKDAEHFRAKGQDPEKLPHAPDSTIIKLFQDVPRADIELLFPNVKVRMHTVDKLFIGVPAAVSGVIVVATKLLATVGLIFALLAVGLGLRTESVSLDQDTLVTLAVGLAAVGSYLTRQITKFKNRKLEFMNTLTRNLYFRNLDNDAGVFHRLLDAAEEEEVKEALLSWYFLRAASGPLTEDELDRAVEGWLTDRWDAHLDFEANDGLAKLRRLDLVQDAGGGRLTAVPVAEAMRRLDERWDAQFDYNAPTSPGGA